MPRQRTTDRGPKNAASAPPFTTKTLHALLRDKVVKQGPLPAATDPAIACLMHVLNILQWRVRGGNVFSENRKGVSGVLAIEEERQARTTDAWSSWVATGIRPGHGRSLGWNMIEVASASAATLDELSESADARAHAWKLMTKERRGGQALLVRSIKQWKDYAQDLRTIFCELLPNQANRAAFRFIEATAPMIANETPSFEAIRTELMRRRDLSRKR